MSQNIISLAELSKKLQDYAFECDDIELAALMPRLEAVLRFARARSQRNTELDQRLHAAAQDENYYTKEAHDDN